MKKHGFTLIELLIVVAIIAILAAIAVPNFLEAQVRSKVARVKADQRTIVTGIEAYSVDYNRCPPYLNEKAVLAGVPVVTFIPPTSPEWLWQGFPALTTPVAYLTSIPRDPFMTNTGYILPGGFKYATFRYETYLSADKWPGAVQSKTNMQKALGRGYKYAMMSFGPSRRGTKPNNNQWLTMADLLGGGPGLGVWVYDASNGTTSYGVVARTNKGEMSGEDFKGLW